MDSTCKVVSVTCVTSSTTIEPKFVEISREPSLHSTHQSKLEFEFRRNLISKFGPEPIVAILVSAAPVQLDPVFNKQSL